ncbi:MAG: 9-O-acetylesterase [Bacteroidales bacterium]|nr:9-O-acetylesterase [Bacteroidales bacterium]
MKRIILIILAAVQALSFHAVAKVTLPVLFSDNMVLQRNSSPEFRGLATPGNYVTIKASWSGTTWRTRASGTGEWRVKIDTPEAGGPYTITISDGQPVTLTNVLIGEVWVCGGQSNMEFRIREGVLGMEETLKESTQYEGLRLLHIEYGMSPRPSEVVSTERSKGWEMSNPESVREFAGTGYFFGLELYKKLGIPIGLIESCWGGTEIEGWISKESLSQVPEYSETVEMLSLYPEDYKERETRYFRELDEWIASTEVAEKRFYEGKDLRTWALGSYDDSSWREVRFPGFLQDQEPLEIVSNGIYYCRKTVEIPQEWAGKDLDLYFSSVDDRDITFFNGVEVGHGDYYLDRRNYKVPGNIVRPGKAVIGLRIVDNAGKCSIGGENGRQLYVQGPDGKKIDLSGMWKYKIPDWQASLPRVPYRTFIGPNIPTYLYNAMIHPLTKYPVKGAIWYQGEANLGRTSQYGDLMTLLVRDWRRAWGLPLDFYICNLHNYIEVYTNDTKSRYAEMREVQSNTARNLEHCGEVILLDVGDPHDTHPKNKTVVGRRLALQAMNKSYGMDVVCDSPYYAGYRIVGNAIRLRFTDINGGLTTSDGKALRGFTMAGPDRVFHKAEARIEGEEVVVECSEVENPLSVRYAWHDNPDCNLVNGAGLPCGSFRTDKWEFEKE